MPGPVAGEEAVAAGGAVVIGALDGQRAHDACEGLGAVPGVASQLPAGMRQGLVGVVATIGGRLGGGPAISLRPQSGPWPTRGRLPVSPLSTEVTCRRLGSLQSR